MQATQGCFEEFSLQLKGIESVAEEAKIAGSNIPEHFAGPRCAGSSWEHNLITAGVSDQAWTYAKTKKLNFFRNDGVRTHDLWVVATRKKFR